jgi:CheY-like chemotaxis protein
MKIMIVDNDSVYLGLLSEVLSLHGYDVTTAHDGEEALAKLQEAPVDFVLSDISMPKMNGMNLHRHIRRDPRLKQLPFAWNSGYRELKDAIKVEDPSIDLKFDKTMPIPNLLFFLGHFAKGRRLGSQGDKWVAC